MIFIFIMSIQVWLTSCFNASQSTSHKDAEQVYLTSDTASFHSLSAVSIDGETIPMSKYKGKKIIILNVASKCGYTPQYADWQAFYDKNKENYVVLGFPCNQFLSQEPGTAEEIETFCQKNYGVTFQMFDKINVKGDGQSSIYKWLSDPTLNGWNSDVPSWNFSKYLVDENGKLLNYFGPKIKPESPEFKAATE